MMLTRFEARERFRAAGESISDWAAARGFNRALVYQVLGGRVKGDRGVAHEISVALSIKPAPSPRSDDGGKASTNK